MDCKGWSYLGEFTSLLCLWYFSPCWRGWGVKHPWKSERRRGLRLELVPSPRLTKHCCSRKENANSSGEKGRRGPRNRALLDAVTTPTLPSYPCAPLSGKCGGYFLLFTRGTARKGGKKKKEADVKIKEETRRVRGNSEGRSSCRGRLSSRSQSRPGGRRQRPPRWQPEWQQLWEGSAAPPCRLHQGSGRGVPIAPIFWASTFFSCLHSRLRSVSWPAAPSLALGLGKAGFLRPRCVRVPPRLVPVGVPAASAVRLLSQLDPGPFGVSSTRGLLEPYGILWVRLSGTK